MDDHPRISTPAARLRESVTSQPGVIAIARILFRCPSDGGVVHTGHHMNDGVFAAMGGRFSFRCARCDAIHHWRREDAWMEVQPGRVAALAHG